MISRVAYGHILQTRKRDKNGAGSLPKKQRHLNRILVNTWNTKPQEGGGVQAGHLQPAPPPASPTPRRDRPDANQQSAAATATPTLLQTETSTVHISELLQGDIDDDTLNDVPESPWTRYFEAAQGANDPNAPTQWGIHSVGAKREILLTVLQKNADRFLKHHNPRARSSPSIRNKSQQRQMATTFTPRVCPTTIARKRRRLTQIDRTSS